jgi:hypothetical protein
MRLFYKQLLFVCIIPLILCSCQKETKNNIQATIKSPLDIQHNNEPVSLSEEQILDCNEYLAQYKAWASVYIPLKKHIDQNPGDVEAVMQVANMSIEITEWAEQWEKRCYCAYEQEFKDRYKSITEQINNVNQ